VCTCICPLPSVRAILGRGHEQAELAAALAGARAGHGRAVLLPGEAGMGKSVLADWQAGQAGMQVARGACSAAGMPPGGTAAPGPAGAGTRRADLTRLALTTGLV